MEQVLDLSATRIAHRREIAEGVLRNKGAEFEQVYVSTTIGSTYLGRWLDAIKLAVRVGLPAPTMLPVTHHMRPTVRDQCS